MKEVQPVRNSDDPWPGAGRLSDGIPDGWHTRGDAAKRVGRSRDTLKRWASDGTYAPTGYITRGQLKVWLYSTEDIDNLINIASGKKAGRPKKETDSATSGGTDQV